jgi:hypothetical protein
MSQSVLLYGSESWVLPPKELKQLETFNRRCARHITGNHIRQGEDGIWIYPRSEQVLKEAGLEPIVEYIRRRKETVEEFAKGRPIYKSCVNSKILVYRSGNRIVWWPTNKILVTNA